MTLVRQALDVIADRRNIAGLLGATAGLGLTFGGVIESGWWAITGGLYVAGFLAGQIAVPARASAIGEEPVAELPAELRRLATRVGPQLPVEARAHLQDILAAANSIETKLATIDPNSMDLEPIRKVLADYVPTTLRNYEALPTVLRTTAKGSDGRTPNAQITDQLGLLAQQMQAVIATLARGDLDALEAQGRFLQSRFATADPFTV
jgi:hypothetical protein